MGIPAGGQVTVDNAIKMMMVKSANDMAILLAEGIDGSVDNFAQEMTDTAHKLGMSESSFVNPNGLPADGQIVSARDLAILARALLREFPEYSYYWHIPAIKFGRRITRNYNPLLGRYAGADGMKTGFICASGFNLVATAQRNNKRLIAVVLGAPSGAARAMKAAELLESGFHQNPLSWLTPSLGTVDALTPMDAAPMNLKDEMCGGHRKKHTEDEDIDADSDTGQSAGDMAQQHSILLSALRAPTDPVMLSDLGPVMPIVVYTGPTRTPDQIQTLQAVPDEDAAAPKKKGKSKTAAKSGESKSASAKSTDDKPAPAKPAAAKPAATKPAAKKSTSGKESQAEPTSTKAASAGPWTALSSSALAGSPPPALRTSSAPDTK
jgi:D-alanyl-D-alanine carboxypeptidase